MEWQKVVSTYATDKGLSSKIYKQSYNSTAKKKKKKKTNNPIDKWAKE